MNGNNKAGHFRLIPLSGCVLYIAGGPLSHHSLCFPVQHIMSDGRVIRGQVSSSTPRHFPMFYIHTVSEYIDWWAICQQVFPPLELKTAKAAHSVRLLLFKLCVWSENARQVCVCVLPPMTSSPRLAEYATALDLQHAEGKAPLAQTAASSFPSSCLLNLYGLF